MVDGTLKQAIDYLAERAAKVRTEGRTWAEKQAQGGSDFMTALGSVAKDPILGKALIGGGVGALAGGASHYFGGEEGDPKARRKGMLSSALTGALAGGALGGGIGAIQKSWPGKGPAAAGAPGAGAPAADPPGTFTDPTTGKKMTLDPQFLRENPQFADKVQEQIRMSPLRRIVHGGKDIAGTALYHAPFSSTVMPFMAAKHGLGIYSANRGLGRDTGDLMKALETYAASGKDGGKGPFADPGTQAALKDLGTRADAGKIQQGILAKANRWSSAHGRNSYGISNLFGLRGLAEGVHERYKNMRAGKGFQLDPDEVLHKVQYDKPTGTNIETPGKVSGELKKALKPLLDKAKSGRIPKNEIDNLERYLTQQSGGTLAPKQQQLIDQMRTSRVPTSMVKDIQEIMARSGPKTSTPVTTSEWGRLTRAQLQHVMAEGRNQRALAGLASKGLSRSGIAASIGVPLAFDAALNVARSEMEDTAKRKNLEQLFAEAKAKGAFK